MKKNIIKAVSLLAALACILFVPVQASATAQGTNGTELEVVQPQKLVVQLGEAWSGVEFQLRTDAGKYPDPIPVGEDGMLRLEIGGSENYTLTCLNSRVAIPAPEDVLAADESAAADGSEEADATGEASESTVGETDSDVDATVDPSSVTEAEDSETDEETERPGEIPVTHIVILVGGLVIAIVILLLIQHSQKNRESADQEDDDDI